MKTRKCRASFDERGGVVMALSGVLWWMKCKKKNEDTNVISFWKQHRSTPPTLLSSAFSFCLPRSCQGFAFREFENWSGKVVKVKFQKLLEFIRFIISFLFLFCRKGLFGIHYGLVLEVFSGSHFLAACLPDVIFPWGHWPSSTNQETEMFNRAMPSVRSSSRFSVDNDVRLSVLEPPADHYRRRQTSPGT